MNELTPVIRSPQLVNWLYVFAGTAGLTYGGQLTIDNGVEDLFIYGLTKMQAHEVIEMWQKIKNEALGPKHSIAKLDEILDGPMKEHWRARARHVRNMGWRWDYSLLSLTIEGVELNARGDRAVVLASIDESAVLREGGAPKAQDLGDEERADSYNSSYQVRYELVKNDKPSKLGLGWKISGGRVLY